MKNSLLYSAAFVLLTLSACDNFLDRPDREVEIPQFNFPETIVFEQNLSSYNIFEEPSDLLPSADFKLVELSSVLFTDYAYKQRLVKVPEGKQMTRLQDGSLDYPDGTVLTKTFYYYDDERDPSQGKRVIETRLLIKENGTWNVATYIWNQDQSDAILSLNGLDTQVSWMDKDGISQSTLYHVPTHNECMTCHQSNESMSPLGPTLRNLNRIVERDGQSVNQISHLQSLGLLNTFELSEIPTLPNYKDENAPLEERGRAYLAMNCSHCHNPDGWSTPAELDFDFRYETPINQAGIIYETDRIIEAVSEGEMPFIGTTLLDQEGVNLLVEYLESL
ncbi:MAG: hypothetical protein AAFY71_22835 [Bacteroidota bacterium]